MGIREQPTDGGKPTNYPRLPRNEHTAYNQAGDNADNAIKQTQKTADDVRTKPADEPRSMTDTTLYKDNDKVKDSSKKSPMRSKEGSVLDVVLGDVGKTVGSATGTKDATDKVGNTVKGTFNTAGDVAEVAGGGATGKVGETVNEAKESVAEKTGDTTNKGRETAEGAKAKVDEAGDNVEVSEGAVDMADEAVKGNPLDRVKFGDLEKMIGK
ncbi:hypothetical protein PG990_014652 [Apiospora arundinis]